MLVVSPNGRQSRAFLLQVSNRYRSPVGESKGELTRQPSFFATDKPNPILTLRSSQAFQNRPKNNFHTNPLLPASFSTTTLATSGYSHKIHSGGGLFFLLEIARNT